MTTDRFTDQLSAYLDGELNDLEKNRMVAHLETCAACRAILDDLRAIVAAAPHYQGQAPDRDLWPGIESHLNAGTPGRSDVFPSTRPPVYPSDRAALVGPRRLPRRWPVLLAASLLMAALGGGAVWIAMNPSGSPIAESPSRPDAETPSRAATLVEGNYQSAVEDLERILAEGRSRLDTATVRVIDESLRKIDAAIAEARAAIARDSSNGYLSRQVTANMRRKLNLLRSIADALART
jgi:anti-sigma factor RsiW